MNVVTILFFALIVLRLWIGMRLFSTAHHSGRSNLYWLALLSFGSVMTTSFVPTGSNPLGTTTASLWLGQGLNVPLFTFSLILFIHTTFYNDRKSPADWFMGITAVGVVVLWYGIAISSLNEPHPLTAVSGVLFAVNFAWLAWVGYTARRGVARERSVEDWVKARYTLVVWYSILQVVIGLLIFVRFVLSLPPSLNDALIGIGALSNIVAIVFEYLAWAAPQGYYRWLNRNYQPQAYEEMTEEQVMGQMMAKG